MSSKKTANRQRPAGAKARWQAQVRRAYPEGGAMLQEPKRRLP